MISKIASFFNNCFPIIVLGGGRGVRVKKIEKSETFISEIFKMLEYNFTLLTQSEGLSKKFSQILVRVRKLRKVKLFKVKF